MSDGYPRAEVVDAAPVYKEMGKDFSIRVSWDELTTAAFSLSHHHAVVLRDALNDKLIQHDTEALQRIAEALPEKAAAR